MDALTKELLRRSGLPIPKEISPNIWNTGSGGTDPVLDRAVTKIQRQRPTDVLGVDIKPMPWKDEYAGTNVLGTTDINVGAHKQKININPAVTLAYPPELTESTLVHELQHVLQNRAKAPIDFSKPYNERPREIEAEAAAKLYRKANNISGDWSPDRKVWDGLPLDLEPIDRLARALRSKGIAAEVK